ncbi:MAG: outer membrane protein assembly factor BamD [Vicinamibacterales bacterium]
MRLLVLVLALGAALTAQQPVNEDLPRRQYESGLSFMQGQRYSEALKDFQAIIDSFPQSQVADNALLQIALYHLDVAHDLAATQSSIDQLLKVYPDSDSAPMAYVVGGRVAMSKGRAPAEVDAALASFERVERLFPGNEAVPAAGFFAGEALRLVRRHDEALDRFRRVTASYPNSQWAARANLAAGYCLVQAERAASALPEVQRVRQMMPQGAVATEALNINTILYRLYVRAPGLPAYAFTGRAIGDERANFDDVIGVAFDQQNRLLFGHKNGIAIFDPAKGALTTSVGSNSPSAFFLDPAGRIFIARDGVILGEKGESTTIAVPQPAPKQPRRVEEIPSAVALSSGQRILVDKKEHSVIRVGADGQYIGPFITTMNTEKLAVNRLDDVAMIEKDSKAITIVDRDGKPLAKIAAKGANYQFDEPVDLAFDQLGHLYVLDRGKGSIYVFGPKSKLITTFTIADKQPGAFTKARAFGLDAAGRIYIFDERAKRIQVYQ